MRRRAEEDEGGSDRSTCFCVEDSTSPPPKKRNLSLSVVEENQQVEDNFNSLCPFQAYQRSTITEQKNREREREREREEDGEPSCPESGALKKNRNEGGREGGSAERRPF